MKGTQCRRCPAKIVFVTMQSGKLMPVDPVPDELGNVIATMDELGRHLQGEVVPAGLPIPDGYRRYMPHWRSCRKPDESVPESTLPGPWPPPNTLF